MNDFDRYKYILGETIVLYQFMENDLKLIYAGMSEGNFYKNIEKTRNMFKGLGQIIQALEELDNSDFNPYFTKETYSLLHKLARQRNYYCHQCSVEFCYNPFFLDSSEFRDSYEKLVKTNESIKSVQKQTEKHREMILAKYNRV